MRVSAVRRCAPEARTRGMGDRHSPCGLARPSTRAPARMVVARGGVGRVLRGRRHGARDTSAPSLASPLHQRALSRPASGDPRGGVSLPRPSGNLRHGLGPHGDGESGVARGVAARHRGVARGEWDRLAVPGWPATLGPPADLRARLAVLDGLCAPPAPRMDGLSELSPRGYHPPLLGGVTPGIAACLIIRSRPFSPPSPPFCWRGGAAFGKWGNYGTRKQP